MMPEWNPYDELMQHHDLLLTYNTVLHQQRQQIAELYQTCSELYQVNAGLREDYFQITNTLVQIQKRLSLLEDDAK